MSAWKITTVFASIVACLTVVSMGFPSEGITLGDHTYYLPTIQDLTEANTTGSANIGNTKNIKIPKEITALSDSINYLQSSFDQSDLRLWLPNESYLDDFWTTAENAVSDNRVVRILHYGDSQIEMDRISYQLRAYMQQHFGGGGPGMLPFRTIIASTSVS